jgi:Leucine-rich repeat (LRR) protein
VHNVPDIEIAALQDLYDATNGDFWNWDGPGNKWNFTDPNPCADAWQGINCSQVPSGNTYVHVLGVDLYDYGLVGSIPGTLQQLTQLTTLDLATNQLVGTIPDSLGQLQQLTVLFLDYNQLTGPVPDSLGQLANVQAIALDSNWLNGTIPDSLGQLTNLQVLSLELNFLRGPIPNTLAQLTELEFVSLGSNQLSGKIPTFLGQLLFLNLGDNQLNGTIPISLGKVKLLRILCLNTNNLSGTIPDALGQLTMLEVLYLQVNPLRGSIPHFLGQLQRLSVLKLGINQLTGTIPQNWTAAANSLQVLHLQFNDLSGPIPESLGNMPQLQSLNLSSNLLTGTIPVSFRRLTSLQVLMLFNNRLRGDVAELFSLSQTNLSTVQLSSNQLTGTLPKTVFLLPGLSSFVAVDNCFDGPLPFDAICNSANLTTLVLDGLHSASSCMRSESLYHQALKLGTVPSCLLSMPSLATLHLSGNGLTGSIPAVASIGAKLIDLSLSHNLLTGKIPNNILESYWNKLDLSYNRLTGTLHDTRAAPYNNATSLYLQHNRLSGVIPGSIRRVGSLSLLENNMFSCRLDRSDVPQQASDSDKYICGSDTINGSLYVWLGSAVFVIAACAVVPFRSKFVQSRNWLGTGCEASQDLFRSAQSLLALGAGSTAYAAVAVLSVYAGVNSLYPTFTYKYAWAASAVFFSGTTVFAVEAALLLLFLAMCLYAAERAPLLSGLQRHTRSAVDSGSTVPSFKPRQTAASAVAMLLSLSVVAGVNVGFVVATLRLSGRKLLGVQIALAVFKLSFSNIMVPALQNRVGMLERENKVTSSQLLLVLLNVVVIPCLVVMVISPACFYDALKDPKAVTSSYKYGGQCLHFVWDINAATGLPFGECDGLQTLDGTTTYTPPFTYSYQCSSSFVTYYAPTFVIMCIISSFVLPTQRLLVLWLRGALSPTSRLYSMVTAATPRILKELPNPQDLAQARSDPLYRPVFDANKLVMSLLTYLALLLTFGALFPPLAVCCAVAMASVVLTARLEVGRYVSVAVAADRQDCVHEVESACAGVATPQQLRMALYLVLAVSCMFYTLFLFDTLGYEVGFAGAFWVLIVVPLLPVVAWALHTAIRLRGSLWVTATRTVKDSSAPDLEVGVELANVPAASSVGPAPTAVVESDTPAAARTEPQHLEFTSANPMHAP